jgi:iron complex transport system ATP-binding protein
MVLHDLNLACRYANNLIVLKRGQIYAQGKPEKIMTEEMIREVFDLDCHIFPDPLTATPMCIPLSRRSKSEK